MKSIAEYEAGKLIKRWVSQMRYSLHHKLGMIICIGNLIINKL